MASDKEHIPMTLTEQRVWEGVAIAAVATLASTRINEKDVAARAAKLADAMVLERRERIKAEL